MTDARCALLLQGPSSRFFCHLAEALSARGVRTIRVNTCPGDALFWALFHRGPGGVSYRGSAAAWPDYLRDLIGREGVTDLVLLGENRPAHAPAMAEARALGLRLHHVELGQVRPDWLSVEDGGAGPSSAFPRDWPALEALAEGAALPDETRIYASSFAEYAAMDVAWNLSNLALSWATHPAYRRHATWHPLAEYGGFLWKQVRARRDRAHAAQVWSAWRDAPGPLFLFPLQLRTDYQIRVHGPDPDLRETARRVVTDFARHAPPEARLLVKEHPMDNGLTPWRRLLREAAARHGAEARVEVVDGGDLSAMLDRAAGVVTVNSTVGLSALRAGRPTKALGAAIFTLPGLVDPQPLRDFWTAPRPPEPGRAETFLRALRRACLVRGAFDGDGARPGAAAVAEKIIAPPESPTGRRKG